jgi:hypothetical protein
MLSIVGCVVEMWKKKIARKQRSKDAKKQRSKEAKKKGRP